MCPSGTLPLTNPICHTLRLRRVVRSEDVASNRLSQMKSKLAIVVVIKRGCELCFNFTQSVKRMRETAVRVVSRIV
jgi:hypothetical protein